ncbi:hypothetical protein CC2G_012206 [Coprinopsis cinerea AmutBmut pab1-1]|nr:hypothetical protein CC2G_012206 [Coprinopsis cinerea AmutBmut pab1-1]
MSAIVRYIPDQSLRTKRLPEMLRTMEQGHRILIEERTGPDDICYIIHYSSAHGRASCWIWPRDENGLPIPPDELAEYQLLYDFRKPSCFCAYLDGGDYSETTLGLVELVGDNQYVADGEYVFECALQRCGYLVHLEQFFRHPRLASKRYPQRASSVDTSQSGGLENNSPPFRGFRQIHNRQPELLRGRPQNLASESAAVALDRELDFRRLALKGLPEDRFWELFVQCLECKHILPRYLFPYSHRCCRRDVIQRMKQFLSSPQDPDSDSDSSTAVSSVSSASSSRKRSRTFLEDSGDETSSSNHGERCRKRQKTTSHRIEEPLSDYDTDSDPEVPPLSDLLQRWQSV